jgi:hypothetical protein
LEKFLANALFKKGAMTACAVACQNALKKQGLAYCIAGDLSDQYTRLAGDRPGAFLKIKNGTKARRIETNLRKPDLYVKKNLDLNLRRHGKDPCY